MNIEVYLHGVPAGQKISTQGEDNKYLQQFYTIARNRQDKVNTELIAEIRNQNIYYTFLKYNLVACQDNRNGSFFGLTLRIDGSYCSDFEGIYYLLSNIYSNNVVGTILKDNKYRSDDFPKSLIKDIEETIVNQIQQKYALSFYPVDNGFAKQRGNVSECNLAEISNNSILTILRKNLIIYLSEEYPTHNNIIDTYKAGRLQQNNIIKDKDTKINSLVNENNQLEKQNKEMKEQNKKLQSQRTFSENIDKIETPIEEIAQYLSERKKQQGKDKISVKKILLIVIAILLAVNVIMFFKFNKTLKEINRNTTHVEQITEDDSQNNS